MFEILDKVCTPRRDSRYSAGMGLFAREDIVIGAGETKSIPLGVKINLEKIKEIAIPTRNVPTLWVDDEFDRFLRTHCLEVFLRKSLAVESLIVPNGIELVNLDYPYEIELLVHKALNAGEYFNVNGSLICFNDPNHSFKISRGQQVAECMLTKHKGYLMDTEG